MNTPSRVTVCAENACTGCGACVEICSKNAILLKDNKISFNAVIDPQKCVGCNACKKVCQNNNPIELVDVLEWKQGWALDNNIRMSSSSGGYATALAATFIRNGGYVCSCVFNSGMFGFSIINRIEEINRMQGSKYVKSSPLGSYKEIKKLLSQGDKVLFIGLPCQVAAMKIFVGEKLNENLYTIDLICHGSPSPKLFSEFIEKKCGEKIANFSNVGFRVKDSFAVYNGAQRLEPGNIMDRYTIAFLDCLSYTQNCYKCNFATTKRCSDITLGDSWGSLLPLEEQKKGISLALCQTKKGLDLVEQADVYTCSVDVERAIKANRQLRGSSVPHKNRKIFEKEILAGRSFTWAVTRAIPVKCIKQDIKRIKNNFGGGV